MSCLTIALAADFPASAACAYGWITNDKVYPYLAGYLSAIFICATLVATLRLTSHLKRTDIFIEFTKQFSDFMKARQDLAAQNPGTAAPANELLARFYALQFSEFYAYKAGTLPRMIFTLWMRSRWREFHAPPTEPQNNLHGVSYQAGWNYWKEIYLRGATNDFTKLMESVRDTPHVYRVPGLVRKYHSWRQYVCWAVRWPFVELRVAATSWDTRGARIYMIVIAGLAAVTLFIYLVRH